MTAPDPATAIPRSWLFIQDSDQFFGAFDRACAALIAAGFSVGRLEKGAPCGLLFGHFDVQKWRNLTPANRDALHGVLTPGPRADGFRYGPVRVTLHPTCPADAASRLAAQVASQ